MNQYLDSLFEQYGIASTLEQREVREGEAVAQKSSSKVTRYSRELLKEKISKLTIDQLAHEK